ncbi:hypothetical protein [Mycobacterium riyadhense]|uniref:hypothetical protein n=1 Tax=Mycobacterium riyadhense TaxID=486698 RepID=UPI001959A47D|nr:hypothetical protein [Mycobacterium riyadhense]
MAATPQRSGIAGLVVPAGFATHLALAWALLVVAVVALLMVVGLVAATTGESARTGWRGLAQQCARTRAGHGFVGHLDTGASADRGGRAPRTVGAPTGR